LPVTIVLNNNSVQSINIASPQIDASVNQKNLVTQFQTFFTDLLPLYNSNGITTITIDINALNTFLMTYINLLNNVDNTISTQHQTLFNNLITNISKASLFTYTGIILVNTTNSQVQMIIPNILFTSNNTKLIDYILKYVNNSMNPPSSASNNGFDIFLTSYKSFITQIVITNPTCAFANYLGLIIRIMIVSYIMQYIYKIKSSDPTIINNISSIVIKLFNNLVFNINYTSNIFYDPNLMNFITFNPSMCESNNTFSQTNLFIIIGICGLLLFCLLILLLMKK
jgi:hypothetical protein